MARRRGQWFGDSELQTVLAGSSVSKVLQLLPTVVQLESTRDVVFERCVLTFQTRRILTATIEGLAYVVWKGDVLSGTSTPTEGLDALSTSTFSWAHASIMHYGPLEVPPRLINGFDGAAQVSEAVTAHQVEIGVKRKVNRANEGIFMRISCDLSSAVKVNVTWRTYYTYA